MPAGRRPIPTAAKALAGKRDRNPNKGREPQFGGEAKCPAHLNKIAKAEWRRVAPYLSDQGVLTACDQASLAAYCSAYARWVEAEEALRTGGRDKTPLALVYTTKTGYPIPNPYIGIANSALQVMHKFCSEFGMTPTSRTRIGAEKAAGGSGDAFTDFMSSIGAFEDEETEELQPDRK